VADSLGSGPFYGRLSNIFCGFRDDLGIHVRSKREANFARYLNRLKEHGAIADWWYEKDAFRFPVKRRTRFYTPDFKVSNTDQTIEYYEVKDYLDQKSRTRSKRMAIYHSSAKVTVVDVAFPHELLTQWRHGLPCC